MKIVHVVPYYYPSTQFGGTPQAVYSLAKAQVNLGHEVAVVTTTCGVDQSEEHGINWVKLPYIHGTAQHEGVNVFYLKPWFKQWSERSKFFICDYFNPAVVEALGTSIDVVHLHEVHIPFYGKVVKVARKLGARIFLSAHGSLHPPIHRGIKKRLHSLGDAVLRWGWFNDLDGYFVTSSVEAKQYDSFLIDPAKINTIPLGLPEPTVVEDQIPFPKSSFKTFLFVGRFTRFKGIDAMLKAFSLLWDQGERFRLILCGHDEEERPISTTMPIVRNALDENPGLYIQSALPHHEIMQLFRVVDWSVCPSRYESFGLVVLESLMSGVPVIVREVYGCLDYVPDAMSAIKTFEIDDDLLPLLKQAISETTEREDAIRASTYFPHWDEIAPKVCMIYES